MRTRLAFAVTISVAAVSGVCGGGGGAVGTGDQVVARFDS